VQQLCVLVIVVLANGQGDTGALTVYNYAWAVYLLPYAVLAVPIATSAFPHLSERAGEHEAYAATAAGTTRAVLIASALGVGVLIAVAWPVARVFLGGDLSEAPPEQLAWALVAFAPGLVGYGLMAHLGRALFARGASRTVAVATVAGWSAVIVCDVALVGAMQPQWAVAALGLGNTIGMTLAGVLLVAGVVRSAGTRAVEGLARAAVAGSVGAVAAGAVGGGATLAFGDPGLVGSVAVGALGAVVATAVFAAVVLAADGSDLRALLRRRFARV
jgi:putative peptidoglycan lipid II flippase